MVTSSLHSASSKAAAEASERGRLEGELEGCRAVQEQLQRQLQELQNNDTVLRARQQHDATVMGNAGRSTVHIHYTEQCSLCNLKASTSVH